MKFSGVITKNQGKVHAKGQGQRSKVKVTEVTTQLNRFRTVTPVWIHIWWWNAAYSLIMLRRGALLFRSQHSNGCNYLSMLGLKLNHVSKRGHWRSHSRCWMILCLLQKFPLLQDLKIYLIKFQIDDIKCTFGSVTRKSSKTYIQHCNDYGEHRLNFKLTKDTPKLTITGNLWGVCCE